MNEVLLMTIGVQNNLDAKKIYLTPMRGMVLTVLEYWE
jgi:hypothetical protein